MAKLQTRAKARDYILGLPLDSIVPKAGKFKKGGLAFSWRQPAR